ncbi:LacI family DNA-binding transcriptional regulator [Sanguibacter sp. A247]|uniref:LacI family DNA-binding transcriptional regulator n=1 Tax=unclassified Sanguibacter TaxID=2645534 RepID=UPI003FD74752
MAVTIADVARAADVSVSTASYALSGKRRISDDTRRRVEAAVAELGYRPHAGARALASATPRSRTIALMAPLRAATDNAVVMQFVSAIVLRARHHGLDVLLLTQDDVDGVERVATSSAVDGVVVMDIHTHDPRVAALNSLGRPAVLVGIPAAPGTLSCIDLDFEAAGRDAVSHLAALGHTSIGVVAHSDEFRERGTSFAVRFARGLTETAQSQDVRVSLVGSDGTLAGSVAAIDTILAAEPATHAFVVHHEPSLPHVLAHLGSLGHTVPGDTSVLAICPANVAERQNPPVTAIEIPAEDIGTLAVDMLVERIAGPQPTETRLVAPPLVDRGSTAVR